MALPPVKIFNAARQATIRAEARFAALRSLKSAFKEWSKIPGNSQKQLAEVLNSDTGHVCRVLAGDKRSMTIETLFLFARAMGRRPKIELVPLDHLEASKPNFDARPGFVQ